MANITVTIEFKQPDGNSLVYTETFSGEQLASSVYGEIARSEHMVMEFARKALEDFRGVIIADASRMVPFHSLPSYKAFSAGESDSLR